MSLEITVRSVQHYLYCAHRWGLIEIDKAWAENAFVTKANLTHQRVHDPGKTYTSRGKKVFTSVPVYHDAEPYNLYGVTDCLELTRDEQGVKVRGLSGRYAVNIVEYKPRKPKGREYNPEDLMQVFAQKVCVDYVFGCDCQGVLYYADVKERVRLPLQENYADYDKELRTVLREMRSCLQTGEIPPVKKGQKCSGCSMKDLCMPKARTKLDIHSEIRKLEEE